VGQTIYSNQNTIGSGLDHIPKNHVIDLGISMLCKF
jgi:hypothetical protein